MIYLYVGAAVVLAWLGGMFCTLGWTVGAVLSVILMAEQIRMIRYLIGQRH